MALLTLHHLLFHIFISLTFQEQFEYHESKWETLPVVPDVSGIRLENINEKTQKAFRGYTESGEIICEPNMEVRVVVFGFWLDQVDYLTFTDSNCITSEFNISGKDFDLRTPQTIQFKMMFPDVEPSWRMCVKQRGKTGELIMVDEMHTWISTSATVQEYHFPLPIQISILFVLFLMSALFSGLNLGLMSLSVNELELIMKCGTESERRYAKSILPIRKRGNYLLCTILLMNVVANASISILFGDLSDGSGTIALLASSAGIVVFGEIFPQSLCVKKGLAVGAHTLFLTRFFMLLTYPLAFPLSKLLDKILGEEAERYDRNRLLELMKMQATNNESADDLRIAVGAMEIANKTAKDVMTKIEDAYMLSTDTILNSDKLKEITERGLSRIPVYEGNNTENVVALLFFKDLIMVERRSNITVNSVAKFHNHALRFVSESTALTDLLAEFKMGDYHLAMVRKDVVGDNADSSHSSLAKFEKNDVTIPLLEKSEEITQLVGLITLEDILEEILQAEIIDESDAVTDNVQRHQRRFAKKNMEVAGLKSVEESGEPISIHTQAVLCQFLRTHHPIFSVECMAQRALEMMIQKNVREVRPRDGQSIKLFECGKPSRRAIVVLDGKADTFFPKHNIHLDAGSWITLGDVILCRLEHFLIHNPTDAANTLAFVPDFDVTVTGYCKFVQFPIPALYHSLKVSKIIKVLQDPSRPPSPGADSTSYKSVRFADSLKVEDGDSRDRNGSIHGLPSIEAARKVSDSRMRSVSAVSATRKFSP